MVAADIYKPCYPKIEVAPYDIELQLIENDENRLFVIVNNLLSDENLKDAVNLLLEIYGVCYVFKNSVRIDNEVKVKSCNWEILPPGEMPSRHVKLQMKKRDENNTETFDTVRLEYIEQYKAEEIVEGINGFHGYYAYVFKEYCVLESSVYGNATFIIPKENWKTLSQLTKRELLNQDKVVARIEHTSKWKERIIEKFKELNINK